MAKTKTKSHSHSHSRSKSSSSKPDSILHSTDAHIKSAPPLRSVEDLLTEAASLLEQSQPELAVSVAEEAVWRLGGEKGSNYSTIVQRDKENKEDEGDEGDEAEGEKQSIDDLLHLAAQGKPTLPAALTVLAEIQLALGDVGAARRSFTRVVKIDPEGVLGSADPWLWLAQLCEEGGMESIDFFERGCGVLRNEIEALRDAVEEGMEGDDGEGREEREEGRRILDERSKKLADALCGMAEVYMTDLSWEGDAEQRCEGYVTEAVAVCPERLSAGVLQTLASVRISQERVDEARAALKRSLQIWKDISPEVEDEARPDYPTRVSLARLLMEVEAEDEAMVVMEGLVKEDDQSVECWYLGGWCQILLSHKKNDAEETTQLQERAKTWLDHCLRLFKDQEYEDEKLRDHAVELRQSLHASLGLEEEDDTSEEEDGNEEGDEEVEFEVDGHDADEDDVEMT